MTTIRLINAGGRDKFVRGDRTGSAHRASTKKKRKNHGLYVRESTVYSVYSENERKRRKRWNDYCGRDRGVAEPARGRRECNSKRE